MNEMQAAYGLLQLKYIKDNIEKRKQVAAIYNEGLQNIKGIRILNTAPKSRSQLSLLPCFCG